jgi:hypothetical protein
VKTLEKVWEEGDFESKLLYWTQQMTIAVV